MPSRERCSSRATPTPPDWTTRPADPAAGWCTAKVASRPRPGTATPKQFGPTSRIPHWRQMSSSLPDWAEVSPEVITTSDRAPRCPHSWATSSTAPAGTVTTARSGASGRAATVGGGGDALDVADVGIHRVQAAREARIPDVVQDEPADRAVSVAHADHRDRARREQRLQAGHLGLLLPARDRVQVGAGLTEPGVSRDRHAQLDDPVVQPPRHAQPGVAEHPQHGGVLRQRRGGEDPDPALPGQRDQVLEQQGGHAPAMHPVGHRERDLRGLRAGLRLVAGHSHQFVAQEAEERAVGRTILTPAYPACLLLGGPPAHAEKAQVKVVWRHGLVQLLDGFVVARAGGPDGNRGAVRQQGIRAPRLGERGHSGSPVLGGNTGASLACPPGRVKGQKSCVRASARKCGGARSARDALPGCRQAARLRARRLPAGNLPAARCSQVDSACSHHRAP